MSKTKLNNVVRSAIWLSYDHKCFYCSESLDWNDLHIDHIIPESYNTNLNEFQVIQGRYELEKDFDINGLANLVPAHSRCNLRKHKQLFPKNTVLYYLGLTHNKVDRIKSEIGRIKDKKNKGQLLSKLQTALDVKLISVEEFEGIVNKVRKSQWKNMQVQIPLPVSFKDQIIERFYLNEDYTHLFDKDLDIPNENGCIEMSNDSKEVTQVRTLNEWDQAVNNGFYPKTNLDIKCAHTVIYLKDLISILKRANMPKVSFFEEGFLSEYDLNYLSTEILFDPFDELSKNIDDGKSMKNLIDLGIVRCNRNRESYPNKIEFIFNEYSTCLTEQFRADFTNNGIEDIFVSGWTRAIYGSFGFGFSKLFTRAALNDNIVSKEL